MYKVIGGDGREYGPIEASVVRNWIRDGRLSRESRILAPGALDWKTLAESPEFESDLRLQNPPPLPTPGAPAVVPGTQQSGLAVTSLVLGIMAVFCLGPIAGIPAIITGHTARNRARRSPTTHGGESLALAGLITGYVGSVFSGFLILAALLLPALAKAKDRAQSVQCVNQMKQVALGLRLYANDHKDRFPSDVSAISNEVTQTKLLVCPADKERVPAVNWSSVSPQNMTYQYSGAEADPERPGEVILVCPIHNNVATADGGLHQMPRSASPSFRPGR